MKTNPTVVKAEWICAVCGHPTRSAHEKTPQKSTTGISACDMMLLLVFTMTITKQWQTNDVDDHYQLVSAMALVN
jgi:hypothetical protein